MGKLIIEMQDQFKTIQEPFSYMWYKCKESGYNHIDNIYTELRNGKEYNSYPREDWVSMDCSVNQYQCFINGKYATYRTLKHLAHYFNENKHGFVYHIDINLGQPERRKPLVPKIVIQIENE